MLLVIPAIDLRGGRCVRLRQSGYEEEAVYFDDPVKMARLWRVQNAKVLHLADLDGARRNEAQRRASDENRVLIREITAVLDIPVQASGAYTLEDVEGLLEAGVYRVVIEEAAPELIAEALDRHTAHRIAPRLEAPENGRAEVLAERASALMGLGLRRIVFSVAPSASGPSGPGVPALRALAAHLEGGRITVAGGIRGYRDLLRLQELAPLGVDSVVVGRALYENRFPCQQFWGWHEKERLDLERFSTAPLAREEAEHTPR